MSEPDFSFDLPDFDLDFDVAGEEIDAVRAENVEEEVEPTEPTQITVIGETLFKERNPQAFPVGLRLIEANTYVDSLQAEIEPKEQEIRDIADQIKKIREEMQARIDELREKQGELETQIREARWEIRQATRTVQQIERELRQALENERVQKDFLEQAQEFERRIAGAPWREFALQHQIDGAKYLAAAKRCILADKMGLGKTLTSISTLDMVNAQRVLVIVPADVLSNFNAEIKRWAPHRHLFPIGKQTKQMRDYLLDMASKMDNFIVTVNYEAWRRDNALIQRLVDMKFDTVILDEAHTIKRGTTNAARGVKSIVMAENVCPKCKGHVEENVQRTGEDGWSYHTDVCSVCGWESAKDRHYDAYARCSVQNVYPMTGTPILNKPQDLFPMLNLLDPVNFYSERDFLIRYCTQNYDNKWVFKPGGMESLVKRLSGKYIGRDRTSAGVVLPKQEILVHEIELDPADYPNQYRVVKQISEHAQILLESGTMNILNTITLILRKRQANVWPAGIKVKDNKGDVVFSVGDEIRESVKLDRLIRFENDEWVGLLPELTADGNIELGERIVIFSQFTEHVEEMLARCEAAGISACRFDGKTSEKDRIEIKKDFDRYYTDPKKAKFMVCFANYKTGGVGLNFTGITQAIILDEEWNPGKRDQAYGRIDRVGQTEETTVHILRIPRTVDSWMANLIAQKEEMIGGFESEASIAQALLEALKNGDMI